jgi:hypothetical protein
MIKIKIKLKIKIKDKNMNIQNLKYLVNKKKHKILLTFKTE